MDSSQNSISEKRTLENLMSEKQTLHKIHYKKSDSSQKSMSEKWSLCKF